jgi:hypothetical protein
MLTTGARRIRPGRGLAWIVTGWDYVVRMPRQAAGLSAVLLGVTLLAALPFSLRPGSVVFSVLAMLYLAALAACCRALDLHQVLPSHAGAPYRSQALWLLGAIAGAVTLALDLLSNSMDVYATAASWFAGGHSGKLLLYFIVIKLLSLVAAMALWLAPALVVLQGAGPLHAMKLSLLGTLGNILPSLLFAVLAFVFCIVAAIPLGLGLLAAMPVLGCGAYLAWREMFDSAP